MNSIALPARPLVNIAPTPKFFILPSGMVKRVPISNQESLEACERNGLKEVRAAHQRLEEAQERGERKAATYQVATLAIKFRALLVYIAANPESRSVAKLTRLGEMLRGVADSASRWIPPILKEVCRDVHKRIDDSADAAQQLRDSMQPGRPKS